MTWAMPFTSMGRPDDTSGWRRPGRRQTISRSKGRIPRISRKSLSLRVTTAAPIERAVSAMRASFTSPRGCGRLAGGSTVWRGPCLRPSRPDGSERRCGAPARTARRAQRRASGGARSERRPATPERPPNTYACKERPGDSARGTKPRTAHRAGSRCRRWCRTPTASSPPLPHVPEASAFPGGAVVALHHLRPKGNQLERLADRLGLAAPAEDRLRPLERRRVEEHVLADQR